MDHPDTPSSRLQAAVAFLVKPKAYAFACYGERKMTVYYSYLWLHILTYVLVCASLGLTWWSISFSPDVAGLSAEGGIVWTDSCDSSSGCSTTMMWDDRESVLKSGQMAAFSSLLCVVLSSFAWRRTLLSPFRPRLANESTARLVDDDISRVNDAEGKRRVHGLIFLLLGDVVVVILLIVGIAIYTDRAQAWYAEYILLAPGNGSAYTSQLSWAAGHATCSVALACAIVASVVPLFGLMLERRVAQLPQQGQQGGVV